MLFNFAFYTLNSIVFLVLLFRKDEGFAKTGVVLHSFFIVIWLWTVLAFREPSGDPWRYMQGLYNFSMLNFEGILAYDKTPVGFKFLNWFTTFISIDSIFFFSVIYMFCIIPLYLAFRERFNKVNSAVLMMLYLLYPFYLTYIGSGFKQGIGFGFMLWGLVCLIDLARPKNIKGIAFLITATLFHSSFWIAVLVYAAWRFIFIKRPLYWCIGLLICCILLAASGLVDSVVTMVLPPSIIDSLGFEQYFDDTFTDSGHYQSLNYRSGFRLDFALFTLGPLAILMYLKKRFNNNEELDVIKIYCLFSCTYFLLCFIPFSDRVAAFSWFLAPYMLYFSFQPKNMNKVLQYFVLICLSSYPLLILTYSKRFFQ
jgi:hypothetical protein